MGRQVRDVAVIQQAPAPSASPETLCGQWSARSAGQDKHSWAGEEGWSARKDKARPPNPTGFQMHLGLEDRNGCPQRLCRPPQLHYSGPLASWFI